MLCCASSPAACWAAAPEAPCVELTADVAYAGTTNPSQTLDVYLPKERAPGARLPVIVFIQGGRGGQALGLSVSGWMKNGSELR